MKTTPARPVPAQHPVRLVMDDGGQTKGATRLVMLALAASCPADSLVCHADRAALAAMAGVTEKHTQRVLTRLVSRGLIERTGTQYRLTYLAAS